MWNSGQQQPGWGWPPQLGYQYNQHAGEKTFFAVFLIN